jgi:hypothetical protein
MDLQPERRLALLAAGGVEWCSCDVTGRICAATLYQPQVMRVYSAVNIARFVPTHQQQCAAVDL